MKDHIDAAKMHLGKAVQDKVAAAVLAASQECSDMTVGFHLQQSYEKGLKAVLAYRKIPFRKTHDIRELLDLLSSNGITVPDEFKDIDEFTPFGVEMRYDDLPIGMIKIDRVCAIRDLEKYLAWVASETGLQIEKTSGGFWEIR